MVDERRPMTGEEIRGMRGHLVETMVMQQAQTIAALRADLAKAVEGLHGYKAAVSFIAADSWDGCSDCINILKAARCADMTEPLTLDETAAHLKRIRKHYEPSLIKELRK